VLVGIIGQINIGSLRPHLLNERFELGRLLGKTLLYGADVPDNFLNQRGASVLKSLTGFDPVTLEFKNSNEQPSIICRFNIIVTCNSRLTVHLEGDTEAWRRRLAIIEYRRPKPQNVIADLGQRILAEEAPGVLNWMLEGQDKIRAAGWQLRLSERQQTRVDNLLLESDGHSVFARECLRREVGGQVTAPECFAAYVEFCTGRGWAALQKNKFASLIGDVIVHQFGLTPRHDIRDDCGKSQRGWRGIALVENSPQPTEENVSEVSERPVSDRTDTILPIHPVNFDLEEVLI
jgi:putative DNA primase/helicase